MRAETVVIHNKKSSQRQKAFAPVTEEVKLTTPFLPLKIYVSLTIKFQGIHLITDRYCVFFSD